MSASRTPMIAGTVFSLNRGMETFYGSPRSSSSISTAMMFVDPQNLVIHFVDSHRSVPST